MIQALTAAATAVAVASCDTIDDERIPRMAVNINLSDIGLWNSYGVAGFGDSRRFILGSGVREPAGFAYSQTSATGFGGVLLIGGMDAFTTQTGVPLAYDLACPVERSRDVRVRVEPERYEAVCDACGSHYDVTMGAGRPLSGPAARMNYGLRNYQCLPTQQGGYIITN